MYDILDQRLQFLPGIGPEKARILLDEAEIKTVRDLLFFFPFRYVDRSIVYKINELKSDMPFVQLKGKITEVAEEGFGKTRRLEAILSDETGTIKLVWFAGINHIKKTVVPGREFLVLGKPTLFNTRFSMSHPEMEEIKSGATVETSFGLHPVYHTTEKMKRKFVTSKFLEKLIVFVFQQLGNTMISETLPSNICRANNLMPLHEAIRCMHLPHNMQEVENAQRRHKFEELFFLELSIMSLAKRRRDKAPGFILNQIGWRFKAFYRDILPFQLTTAQKRVVAEIRNDLFSGRQMNRLVQGDVGSGKTIVAILTMLLVLDNSFQVCLMAPTEILAEQHFKSISGMLERIGVKVKLLTGIVKGKKRKTILEGLASGEIDVIVGTHALLEEKVIFHNLGCAIIDEQHRFGVEQRSKLWRKNQRPPHILVMTATPIPRTLAMTVYGDLDVSVIDELPPGRKPITTLHVYEQKFSNVTRLILSETSIGHQVYIVYPLIEGSEKLDLKNLEEGYEVICRMFPNLSVGKLHGKMNDADKNRIMETFAEGEIKILVSTSVIEVGVDVPKASVMIIVNAERFGLAQLHQLRGRVGRGAESSYCVLVTNQKLTENTRRRMEIMVSTSDGFVIAEEDLRLRGPGDIEGTQQSGLFFNLKVANIVRDNDILERARQAARTMIESDPSRSLQQNMNTWERLKQLHGHDVDWSSIS
jgi:ATP-dependent DNA helicase RecG